MIKPSASDIVSMIGSALVPYDYTPIGINKDKDRKGLEESIRYFILKKVQCVLAKLSKENFEKKIARTPYPAYTKIVMKLKKKEHQLYKAVQKGRSCGIEINSTPEISFLCCRVGNTCSCVHVYSQHYIDLGSFVLTPKQIHRFFGNIEQLLAEYKREIIESGLRDCLPKRLQPMFISAKLTKDQGHSVWDDARNAYGHEFRLTMPGTHQFAIAWIPYFFWRFERIEVVYKSVAKAYNILKGIEHFIPKEVAFECKDRNDNGVSFTEDRNASDYSLCYLMDTIHRNLVEEQVTIEEEDYQYLIDNSLLKGKMTVSELIEAYEEGIKVRDADCEKIRAMLNGQEFTVDEDWDCIHLYFMVGRDSKWERESCLKIPYSTDLSFLQNYSQLKTAADKLRELFYGSNDYETSVGLLTPYKLVDEKNLRMK